MKKYGSIKWKKMIFNTNPYGGMNGGKKYTSFLSNVYEIDL
jgi:hypothetical protein